MFYITALKLNGSLIPFDHNPIIAMQLIRSEIWNLYNFLDNFNWILFFNVVEVAGKRLGVQIVIRVRIMNIDVFFVTTFEV